MKVPFWLVVGFILKLCFGSSFILSAQFCHQCFLNVLFPWRMKNVELKTKRLPKLNALQYCDALSTLDSIYGGFKIIVISTCYDKRSFCSTLTDINITTYHSLMSGDKIEGYNFYPQPRGLWGIPMEGLCKIGINSNHVERCSSTGAANTHG